MHYDRFKDELSPKVHKEVPAPGNGLLYDLGSHLIDQALQMFGKPNKIFADIQIMRPISRVVDYFEVLLYYEKLRVRLKASNMVREALPAYALYGLERFFHKAEDGCAGNVYCRLALSGKSDWGIEPPSEMGLCCTQKKTEKLHANILHQNSGNYGEYYDGIYEAIRNNKPLPVTAEDGLEVIKIIEAAHKSNETGCVVSL